MEANSLVIRGGNVVTEDAILPNHDIVVENGTIARIAPTLANARTVDAQLDENTSGMVVDRETGFPVVDARGAYVVPGMIDVHSDYIESVASPRPSVVMDLPTSLYKVDRELVSHGVTTIYHSLSVYGAKIFDHKPIRNFENVRKLAESIFSMRESEEHDHLIRHRFHLRLELDSVDRVDEVYNYLQDGKVDLISIVMEQQAADKIGSEQLSELAELAHEQGVSLASHDDDSKEKLDYMGALGASISEFPVDMEIARDAHERGMFTLAGAPNVMMGHSHSGNLSAREGVARGVITMLCSDYYPAALIDAVFILHRECAMSLSEAFALVTANPAKAVGIYSEVGTLTVGKRADILLVREIGCTPDARITTPVITRAFVGGNSVYRSHYPDQPHGYDR